MKKSFKEYCSKYEVDQLNAAMVCMEAILPLTHSVKFKKDSEGDLIFPVHKVEEPDMSEKENAYGGKFISLCLIHSM